jgi:hypothetical protein
MLSSLALELGNSHTALPAVAGHENASVRAGRRRRRSSQRPGGNGRDRVKVRQARCTEPTWQTRTGGMFIMGSASYKRPSDVSRVPVKASGLKPPSWKAGCGESRTSGLERGKG